MRAGPALERERGHLEGRLELTKGGEHHVGRAGAARGCPKAVVVTGVQLIPIERVVVWASGFGA